MHVRGAGQAEAGGPRLHTPAACILAECEPQRQVTG